MAHELAPLMLSLDQAVRRGDPTLFTISGRGTVSVYPRQHCYVSDVQDWEGVYAAPRDDIRVSPATWTAAPAGAFPLEELQWRLAFHDARQEADGEAGRELVHLASWPNLTRLPEEMIEPVTRICALLWRKPTVGYLIPKVLDLPQARVASILRVLRMFGHVNASAASAAVASGAPQAQEPARGPGPTDSIASKFWQRLMRLQAA